MTKEEIMKKKNLFVSALVATLLTQPISVFASAAMHGKNGLNNGTKLKMIGLMFHYHQEKMKQR